MVSKGEQAKLREWAEGWKRTGRVLKEIRLKEFRQSDIGETILSLSDASEAALLAYPPKATSGLVDMQRIFSRNRKKG